jgi:hypothetical protein
MNKGITGLAWGLSLLCTTASAADNINTPGDQQWLKQQENLSEQLRQHPDKQLQQELEAQISRNPLPKSDRQFIDNLVSQQKAANQEKPAEGALYFVSFSIPEEGLKRMLHETRQYGIPATLRGLINNDMRTTTDAVLQLVKDGVTDGCRSTRHCTRSTASGVCRLWWYGVRPGMTWYAVTFTSNRRWRKSHKPVTAHRWPGRCLMRPQMPPGASHER